MKDTDLARRVGQRIVATRYERGLTQKDLAESVDRWPSSIMRIEHGLSMPPPATLQAIARALGVEVADLLPEEEAA